MEEVVANKTKAGFCRALNLPLLPLVRNGLFLFLPPGKLLFILQDSSNVTSSMKLSILQNQDSLSVLLLGVLRVFCI